MRRDSPPSQRLQDYRSSQSLSLVELAEKLASSPSHLSMVITGTRLPGLRLAIEIERVVGIKPCDWVAAK